MTYTALVRELQIRDHVANRDAYYRAYLLEDQDSDDVRVLFQWGRNGARPQQQALPQASYAGAEQAIRGKLDSKRAKGYEDIEARRLVAVPDDILEAAGVGENGRSRAAAKVSADPFARVEVDTDRLIRMVTGPAQVQAEAITLKRGLEEQLTELRRRLTQAEGSLELASDVLAMKLGA